MLTGFSSSCWYGGMLWSVGVRDVPLGAKFGFGADVYDVGTLALLQRVTACIVKLPPLVSRIQASETCP